FAEEHNERLKQTLQKNQYNYPHHPLKLLKAEFVDEICHRIEHGGNIQGTATSSLGAQLSRYGAAPDGALKSFLEHPDCQLIHFIRLQWMTRDIKDAQHYPQRYVQLWPPNLLGSFRRAHAPPMTLSDLADAIRSLPVSDDLLAQNILQSYYPIL